MGKLFAGYESGPFFDEMFQGSGQIRAHYQKLFDRYDELSLEEFERRRAVADKAFLTQGVTFTVYLSLIHI